MRYLTALVFLCFAVGCQSGFSDNDYIGAMVVWDKGAASLDGPPDVRPHDIALLERSENEAVTDQGTLPPGQHPGRAEIDGWTASFLNRLGYKVARSEWHLAAVSKGNMVAPSLGTENLAAAARKVNSSFVVLGVEDVGTQRVPVPLSLPSTTFGQANAQAWDNRGGYAQATASGYATTYNTSVVMVDAVRRKWVAYFFFKDPAPAR